MWSDDILNAMKKIKETFGDAVCIESISPIGWVCALMISLSNGSVWEYYYKDDSLTKIKDAY